MTLNKLEAIKLLQSEGWTKADAERALESVDFKTNPDELFIRKKASQFAGSELINRQRLQAAQKGQVTKKNKEIEQIHEEYALKIARLQTTNKPFELDPQDFAAKNKILEEKIKLITSENQKLIETNNELKKDNRDLKNIVDEIRLKLAISTKKILNYKDSEIRKAIIQLFQSTLG